MESRPERGGGGAGGCCCLRSLCISECLSSVLAPLTGPAPSLRGTERLPIRLEGLGREYKYADRLQVYVSCDNVCLLLLFLCISSSSHEKIYCCFLCWRFSER